MYKGKIVVLSGAVAYLQFPLLSPLAAPHLIIPSSSGGIVS